MGQAREIPASPPKPAPFARRWRPSVSPAVMNIAVASFIMLADNRTFWRRGVEIFDESRFSLAMFGVAVWGLTLFLMTLFGFRWLRKPVAVFLLLVSAVTSYFMDTLGVMIDRDMIQNAATTTVNESKHLLTPDFMLHVLLWGLLPAAIVLWVRVRPRGFRRDLLGWAGMSVASLALVLGLLAINFKTFSAVLRERKELIGSYQPGAPLGGAFQYADMMMKSRDVTVAPLGLDAAKGPQLRDAGKPVLTVLVVGETARAQNFGLNGYARDTTPELAARDVINFPDVSSCGTATAVSMPCMFSALGRARYSYERGKGNENLLDVLNHAGVKVTWWDNNTGDKGVADRVESAAVTAVVPPCDGECTDEVFLDLVRRRMAEMTEDTVLVLHQIGSHGPAYYLRYPKDRERFTPACHSAEFAECTGEEIVNAYDNSILYTDHTLAALIDLLAGQDKVIPALLYVSDHGESLGENGLYLHGAPYFMAPATQTHVPMMMWLSDAYTAAFGVDTACLRAEALKPASHDNLFSSVLGLMDITTSAKGVGADLISACRKTAS
jgi:lipid A ethanolaminephosphotransferase